MSMEISKQVVSLELSKRLKELGVKQESLFKWHGAGDEWKVRYCVETGSNLAAFTVAELGIEIAKAKSRDVIRAYGHVWNVPDTKMITELGLLGCMTDPDIAASMLIYLLENKLTSLT